MFNGCVTQNKDWKIFACLLGVCHVGLCLTVPSKRKKGLIPPLLRVLLRFHPLSFLRETVVKKQQCPGKKKASDRAIGQQGNYKAENNSHLRSRAFQHAHPLQACLIPDFEMPSRWEGM